MKGKRIISFLTALVCVATVGFNAACAKNNTIDSSNNNNQTNMLSDGLKLSYSFDEDSGNTTVNNVTGADTKIEYIFNAENQDKLFKPSSDPLRKDGVKGNSLYMDGFSTCIKNYGFTAPTKAITMSAWVAPRVFENLANYGDDSLAKGNPRLTSVINKGNIELGEGFLLGYGRLGLWGVQLALRSLETEEDFVVSFYDPLNVLPLYEWSNIAVSFDGETGYIALFFNGERAYEAIIPDFYLRSHGPHGPGFFHG